MTEHQDSPQNGPVDIKTDKDSHTPRTEHTEAAGRQNGAYRPHSHEYVPTTAEVRAQFEERGNLGWLPNVDPDNWGKQAMSDAFDRWLRKVKAEAWYEGYIAAVQNAFPPYDPTGEPMQMNNQNPYRSEEA